ncbi:phosphoglycerate dehydrogenase [Aliikangiella coralliicola]|uniref:phosphoglycerate dehydrogenase n=1 Tax=Aliikangiella coralliicola TaxID=2592383 RepID=UPI001FE48B20|nr:phosphoglycerate dehydrogenase [Aliikangiella coralliicola]
MTTQATSFNKDKIKIVLLEGIHASAEKVFRNEGYTNIVTAAKSLPVDELKETLADAHFLGIRSRTQVNPELLSHAPRLAAIGCFCIGTNQVDLEATELRGIPVFNAPFANTRSVAELVLGEMILLLRGVPQKSAAAHRGEWIKSAANSFETRGKILGIVGYGHIGTQTGILAENLGMKVQFFDIESKLALGNARAAESFHQLLETSDVVTFHVPETDLTKNMMDETAFKHVKQGAILINASRGTVVDIDSLANALKTGAVNGAAIDVFPKEPKSNQEEFLSPLREYDNVILTPHVGGSTMEAQANIGIEVSEKLVKYSDNGSTLSSVNLPEVALPSHKGKHRICHIHQNEPGILARINDVFSSNNVNISAQYLQTSANVGYVVTDIDQASSDKAFEALKQIPGTIKTRILY